MRNERPPWRRSDIPPRAMRRGSRWMVAQMIDADLLAELQRIEALGVELADRAYRARMALTQETAIAVDRSVSLPTDLIEVEIAAELAHRPADTVRTWCRSNSFGQPGGFALKMRRRWLISRKPFIQFLRR